MTRVKVFAANSGVLGGHLNQLQTHVYHKVMPSSSHLIVISDQMDASTTDACGMPQDVDYLPAHDFVQQYKVSDYT